MNNKKDYFGIFNSWDAIDENIRKETREMLAECNDCEEEDISDERVMRCILEGFYDERSNLDIETNGYIVAYANLGFWNGRRIGTQYIGTNVNDILDRRYFGCDDCEWYADRYNVRCTGYHHDGRHYVVFRMVDSKDKADKVCKDILLGHIKTEQDFFKATKSIRPYVARTYGWKEYGKQKHIEAA